jgi:hypothetical protein
MYRGWEGSKMKHNERITCTHFLKIQRTENETINQ